MPSSKKMIWAGRVATGLPAFLVLSGSIVKLMQLPSVIDGFRQSGFQPSAVLPVGIIEFVCTVIYLIPRTRFLGAVLLTGLLGGAVATNIRMGDPTWILPAICGVLVWAGLFLRDESLRALIPVRS